MRKAELKELPIQTLKRICRDMSLNIPKDFTKRDITDSIIDRLGSPEGNPVGWKLLDQYAGRERYTGGFLVE